MHVQVEIETPVFLQSVEIGENRGMWSVVRVKAWDSSTSRWQTVHEGEADPDQFAWYQKTEQYNKFTPSICQTTFAASIIRIELDTYTINDWNELDYVKVIGSTEQKVGVLKADVATQTAHVVYVPDRNFNGDDVFCFEGCDCAYNSKRRSDEATVTISVGASNDRPVAEASSVTIDCANDIADTVTLSAYDIDTSSTALVYSVESLPDGASLSDAATGDAITQAMLPATLSGPEVQLLANYLVDTPPSNFTFSFSVTDDNGAVSALTAFVEVTCRSMQCNPGSYFDMTEARSCLSCPAGTFAPGTAVRSSCDDCAVGTFTASEGSVSCGSCANGQVSLNRGSTACIVCPTGATCDDTSSLFVNPGMWKAGTDSLGIYECPFGPHACLGANATNENCADGYGGVLCAVCQPGYIQTAEGCTDCSSLKAPIATIIVMVMGASIALIISYLVLTNKRIAAMMEAISISAPFKIYFSTIQILGTFSILLQDVLFQPLKGFFATMSFITDFADLFSGFGLSCANEEMRTFKAKLLISTLVPVMAGVAVAVFFFLRISLAHPERLKALKRARSTAALLVLYVTLPSTATMIFRTFVRDGRALGSRGEHYLIADYAGKPQCTA